MIISGNRPPPFSRKEWKRRTSCDEGSRGAPDLAAGKRRKDRPGLLHRTGKVLSHLRRADFTDFFQVVIGGDMVEHSKPLPDIYLKACELLGVKPENAIAIEDSPNGIRSAAAAGMLPVMVPDMVEPTPEIEELLYHKCDSLFAVRDFLEDML